MVSVSNWDVKLRMNRKTTASFWRSVYWTKYFVGTTTPDHLPLWCYDPGSVSALLPLPVRSVEQRLGFLSLVQLTWVRPSLTSSGSPWLLKMCVGGDTWVLLLTNIPFLGPWGLRIKPNQWTNQRSAEPTIHIHSSFIHIWPLWGHRSNIS